LKIIARVKGYNVLVFIEKISELFFPALCAVCLQRIGEGEAVCKSCLAKVAIHTAHFCGACGARVPQKRFCHKNFPYLLGAAADYGQEEVRLMTQALKFKGVRELGKVFGDILASYVESLGTSIRGFTVVPIPLGKRREKERGFNQADLIGARFAARLGLPFAPRALFRRKETEPQSELDRPTREKNLSGAFEMRSKPSSKVILIDDVTTSGATFYEASLCLKRAGTRIVRAYAVSKA